MNITSTNPLTLKLTNTFAVDDFTVDFLVSILSGVYPYAFVLLIFHCDYC